jgi:hypothetical protein
MTDDDDEETVLKRAQPRDMLPARKASGVTPSAATLFA